MTEMGDQASAVVDDAKAKMHGKKMSGLHSFCVCVCVCVCRLHRLTFALTLSHTEMSNSADNKASGASS